MDLAPPAGSNISITSEGSDPKINIPVAVNNVMRFASVLFMLGYLLVWVLTLICGYFKLNSGNAGVLSFLNFAVASNLILIVPALSLYSLFRPRVPDSLVLKPNCLTYEFRIPQRQFSPAIFDQGAMRSYLFPERIRLDLDRRHLQSLRLIKTQFDSGLTIDVDAIRFDIAPDASDVEREWIWRLLVQHYSLYPVSGSIDAAVRV